MKKYEVTMEKMILYIWTVVELEKIPGPPGAHKLYVEGKSTWNFSKFQSENPYIRRELENFPSPTSYILYSESKMKEIWRNIKKK